MCVACGVRGGGGLRGRLLWYSCSEEVCVEIKTRRESVKEMRVTPLYTLVLRVKPGKKGECIYMHVWR